MSTEAFSVAIRLKLLDGVTSGLIAMTTHFAGLNKHVAGTQAGLTGIEARLRSIKTQGLFGGALLGAGIGALELLSAPLKAATDYERAFLKFKALNLGDAVNKQADQFARSANVMSVSAKDLMTTMAESVGLFGSYSEAQKNAPLIAQLNAANSAIYGGKVGSLDERGVKGLMKFIDRRGGTRDEDSFKRNLNIAERLVTGSGGFINFGDLDQLSKKGGTAFRGLSDEGVLNYALLLQEQGGAGAGNSLMSIYQNLIAGRTPVKTMAMLQAMGLGTISQTHSGSVGGKRSTSNIFSLKPEYAAALQSDPMGFFRDVWLPLLSAQGITSEAGILKATNDLLSNRTASNQASIFTTQMLQATRDAKLAKGAMGYNEIIAAYQKSPQGKLSNLDARYSDAKVQLGLAAMPIMLKAVTALTTLVTNGSAAMREFPGVTRGLITAFAGLGGLAVAGGSMMLITAGLRGLGTVLTLGMGSQLSQAAEGLGKVAKVSMVISAATAGWEFGSFINKKFSLDEKIGGFFDTLLHGKYDPNAITKTRQASQAPGKVVVNMDGKKVGEIVQGYQNRALAFPQTGTSHYDATMSPLPAGGY